MVILTKASSSLPLYRRSTLSIRFSYILAKQSSQILDKATIGNKEHIVELKVYLITIVTSIVIRGIRKVINVCVVLQ